MKIIIIIRRRILVVVIIIIIIIIIMIMLIITYSIVRNDLKPISYELPNVFFYEESAGK